MIRCPRCGLRLRDAEPVCAQHGRAPEPPVSESAAPVVELEQACDAFLTLGYRVHKLLGRGGFGVVYGAERLADQRQVAIKVALRAQPLAAESLAHEANALELVGAPHVPQVIERGVLLDQYFVVIEYIASQTLADLLVEQAGPMPLARFASLIEGMLAPIEAIHAHGLVHRDLKPENIFIAADNVAKVIDFGLAKQESRASEASSEQDAIGTAEYMSPEQCEGMSDIDRRADIYSIGVLCYELLSGAPPFWGQAADVRDAHRSRRPAPLSRLGIWPAVDAVIRRCLVKDREQRFESVASLRSALRVALKPLRDSSRSAEGPQSGTIDPTASKAIQTGAAAREKRNVGLLFFESRSGVSAVQQLVSGSGGQVVQMSAPQYVAAFGHDVGDNPVRIALLAAQRLLFGKHSTRLCVDLAPVSVQVKPDGSKRLLSAVFSKKDRFPQASEPGGITLTNAALEVVPDLNVAQLAERPDRHLLNLVPASASTTTTFGLTPTLLGREPVLSSLLSSASRALLHRQPTIASVASEPGYGKTHLGRVLAQDVERLAPALPVLLLTAREAFVGAAPQLLPELLRRTLELPELPPADGGKALLCGQLGSELGEQVWAAAAFALGYVDAEHPDVRRLAAAPGALRLAASRAAGEAIRRRAARAPLAIIVDDAHLAEDAVLDALEYAALKEAAAPLFVCVLVRPNFEQARQTWATRAARSLKLTLSALPEEHAMELARRLLHPVEYVPPLVLARLAERTQGVPRLMVELVRGLKRDGLVRRSERGTGSYLATDELDKLPDLPIVQWNASREVEGLAAQLAGHARLSSVLGSNFSVAEVDALMSILERDGLPDDMQLDASVGIERLIDAGLLIRHRTGLLDFRYSLLRDTIYQQLPEAQRLRLHRAAYEMYGSLSMPRDTRIPRLALHALACGEKEAAAAAYLELAERSTKAQAYLEAEAAFGRALESLASEDARVVLAARGRGLMRFRLGRHEDSLKDLRLARKSAESNALEQEELELCLDESTVLDWTRDLVHSAALVRSVESRVKQPDPLLAARLGMGLSRVHHRQGETEACVQLGAAAAEQARALGDAGYETRVIALLLIGTDCCNLGRLDEAEQHFQAVIAEARAHADLHHEGAAYINRAFLWFARKDVPRLLEDLSRATQIAREIGQPLLEYPALINQAEVAYSIEQLDRAADYTQRTIELAEQLWSRQNRELGTRELLLARIELYRGELGKARKLVEAIDARLSAPRGEGSDELDFFPPDRTLFEMAELATRDSSELEWSALMVRASAVELQPSEEVELYEMRALTAHRLGRDDESRRSFERAIAISAEKPNLLSERVVRRYASLFSQPGA